MISSSSNPKLKNLKKLIRSAKYRNEKREFVVEGLRSVKEVPKNLVKAIFYTEESLNLDIDLDAYDCEKLLIAESLMKSISATRSPQGIVFLCDMPKEADFVVDENSLVLVLDKISDPGNAGTIIRTARASGVDYLVFLEGSVDIFNDKVIRSSMGAIFKQKIISGVDMDFVSSRVKTDIYGAFVKDADVYYENDLSHGLCLVMGNEANGICEDVEKMVDRRITIPMERATESLNVAISTGILLFEIKRQRDAVNIRA